MTSITQAAGEPIQGRAVGAVLAVVPAAAVGVFQARNRSRSTLMVMPVSATLKAGNPISDSLRVVQ